MIHRTLTTRAGTVAAYGAALHGPLRLPTATFPQEPYKLWLTCRNSVAPFRDSAIVISGNNTATMRDGFSKRAEKHFANVLPVSIDWKLQERQKSHLLANDDSNNAATAGSEIATTKKPLTVPKDVMDFCHHHHNNKGGGTTTTTTAASSSGGGVDLVIAHTGLIPCRSPSDVASLMCAYRPLLKPHGCFCLAGVSSLPGELLCSDDDTARDWADLTGWLVDKSTEEEKFAGMKKDSNRFHVDRDAPLRDVVDVSVLRDLGSALPYELVREMASSCGLVNCTLYKFAAEYPVTMRELGGLVRSMPAYRREVALTVEADRNDNQESHKNNDNRHDDDDDDLVVGGLVKHGDDAVPQRVSFVSRRRRQHDDNGEDHDCSEEVADPFECFKEIALLRHKARYIQQQQHERKLIMRLKLEHWMWVCDRRPLSRDSVSFVTSG